MHEKDIDLTATMDAESACREAELVIIATPTDYDEEKNLFNAATVESGLELAAKGNPNAIVVMKSAVPVGYAEHVVENFGNIPNRITASVAANGARKDYIARMILEQANRGAIVVYRLTMKAHSDNLRASSISGVIRLRCWRPERRSSSMSQR